MASATQGVALGSIVVPFQGDERSSPIVTKVLEVLEHSRNHFAKSATSTSSLNGPYRAEFLTVPPTQASGTCGAFDLGYKNDPVGVENT